MDGYPEGRHSHRLVRWYVMGLLTAMAGCSTSEPPIARGPSADSSFTVTVPLTWMAAGAACRDQGLALARCTTASECAALARAQPVPHWVGFAHRPADFNSWEQAQFSWVELSTRSDPLPFELDRPADNPDRHCLAAGQATWSSRTCDVVLPALCIPGDTLAASQAGRRFVTLPGGFAWLAAEQRCAAIGGRLARIWGATELQQVAEHLLTPTAPYEALWIGAHDQTTEGYFQWTDGAPVFLDAFYGEEPDGGDAQNCVALSTRTQRMHTRPCDFAHGALCEILN